MTPITFVEVCQESDGLWPCPWPGCTANTLTPEEFYLHVGEHPTGPYHLLRGNDGMIAEIRDVSQALVLHEEWGIGKGEVYWLVGVLVCTTA